MQVLLFAAAGPALPSLCHAAASPSFRPVLLLFRGPVCLLVPRLLTLLLLPACLLGRAGDRINHMPFAGAMAIAIAMAILLLAPCAEATSEGLMIEQILSDKGCGAFAGLVASTAGVAEVFRSFVEKAEAKTTDTFDVFGDKRARNAGLTIFCPDDEAVAAFVPRFNKLSADAQVALLLYHGVPSRRSEEALRLIDGEVPTLDKGPLPGSRSMLTIDVYEGIVVLYSPSPSVAAVTEMVVDHDRLAVYIIDDVMIPRVPEIGFKALLLFFGLLALGALVLVQVFFLFRDV